MRIRGIFITMKTDGNNLGPEKMSCLEGIPDIEGIQIKGIYCIWFLLTTLNTNISQKVSVPFKQSVYSISWSLSMCTIYVPITFMTNKMIYFPYLTNQKV